MIMKNIFKLILVFVVFNFKSEGILLHNAKDNGKLLGQNNILGIKPLPPIEIKNSILTIPEFKKPINKSPLLLQKRNFHAKFNTNNIKSVNNLIDEQPKLSGNYFIPKSQNIKEVNQIFHKEKSNVPVYPLLSVNKDNDEKLLAVDATGAQVKISQNEPIASGNSHPLTRNDNTKIIELHAYPEENPVIGITATQVNNSHSSIGQENDDIHVLELHAHPEQNSIVGIVTGANINIEKSEENCIPTELPDCDITSNNSPTIITGNLEIPDIQEYESQIKDQEDGFMFLTSDDNVAIDPILGNSNKNDKSERTLNENIEIITDQLLEALNSTLKPEANTNTKASKNSKRSIEELNSFDAPIRNSKYKKPAFVEKLENESSAEKAVRINKGIQKLMNFVSIVGHVDSYLTARLRTAVKSLARSLDHED